MNVETTPAPTRGEHRPRGVPALGALPAIGDRLRRRPALLLGIGYLAQVLLRLWLAVGRNGPLVFADETAYLAHARVIAGGVPGELSQAMFYRGGYALLISPAFLLSSDPVRIYHLILGFNALLTSVTFP